MNLIKKRPNLGLNSIITVILVIVFAGAFFYLDSSSTGFAFLEPEITVQPEIAAEKQDFSINEDVNFTFEFLSEEDSKKINKEIYPITGFAILPFNKEVYKKEWKKGKVSINTLILDHNKNPTDIELELKATRNGKFDISLPKLRGFKPGLYTLEVNFTRSGESTIIQQNFTWGVLAINTDKSIYLENEESLIGIGILDDRGIMVCNADISLKIKDPSGKIEELTTKDGDIKISEECNVYQVTNLPDYYTTYTVNKQGLYDLNLTATTIKGSRSIIDHFLVKKRVEFDVKRNGPTRIYPPAHYVMNFTINADKDYKGKIRDYVPTNFNILPQRGLSIDNFGDIKILTWDVVLVKGETSNLFFEFVAPPQSPQFYILGPLEVGEWQETRYWQIASDTVVNIVPIADASRTWDNVVGAACTSTTHYDCVDDDPSSAHDSDDGAINTGTDEDIDVFDITTANIPAGSTISSVEMHAYIKDSGTGNNKITLRVIHDATYESAEIAAGTSYAESLYNVTSSETWEASDLDGQVTDIGIRVSAIGSGKTISVTQSWLEIIYSAAPDSAAPSFSGPLNQTNISQYFNNTFNITITDNTDLGNYTFSWNDSGSFVNDSIFDLSSSYTTWDANTSKNISRRGGEVIGWRYYACDNSNNCNVSATENFTVPADHYWNKTKVDIGTVTVNTGNTTVVSEANFSWHSPQSATITCS